MKSLKTLLLSFIICLTLLTFWFACYLSAHSPALQLAADCETNQIGNSVTRNSLNGSDFRVWPEQLHTDRILEQLQLKKVIINTIKTIYAAPNFKVPLGSGYFKDAGCSVDQCAFVSDLKEADAVIFKDVIYKSRKGVNPKQIWILYILESPVVSGSVNNQESSVNWTATYREDSDIVTPYEKWVYYDVNRKERSEYKNYAAGKTKQVAWFVSNCVTTNGRQDYAHELQKYINVDIYGRCGPLKCKKSSNQECGEMLDNSYKFYLAFENANCRDYITEKFFVNGLGHNVIPIVMGAHPDDYRRVAPVHSYIHVDDFPSARDLADYLNLLDANDELYNSYFQWKGTGEFINTKFFCRVCAMLHQDHPPKFYEDFRAWWAGDDGKICRKRGWV